MSDGEYRDELFCQIKKLRTENETLRAQLATALIALEACDEAMAYMSEYDIPIMLPDDVKEAIKTIKVDISNE
jgi:crotonobetainyl-CoA:carnitine CoA-transferase CaiB-like acyl-CoA transferase